MCTANTQRTGEIHTTSEWDDAHAERCYFFPLFHVWLIAVACISQHCSWPFSFEIDTDVFRHEFRALCLSIVFGVRVCVWIWFCTRITFNCLPSLFVDDQFREEKKNTKIKTEWNRTIKNCRKKTVGVCISSCSNIVLTDTYFFRLKFNEQNVIEIFLFIIIKSNLLLLLKRWKYWYLNFTAKCLTIKILWQFNPLVWKWTNWDFVRNL